ncbi:MAG: YerC/YecD family TrpR-related protein [Patescibacteria group bacterium]|jgi:TrpR-related protein YerC/YecD
MRLTSAKLNSEEKKEILKVLFQVVTDLSDEKETEEVLRAVLTENEIISIAKRIALAKYLSDGLSYAEIKKKLKTSSATISLIQNQIFKNAGFEIILKKIETECWASKWEKKIKKLFNK